MFNKEQLMISEKFRKAIAVIISAHEGGFQNRTDDPGNYRNGELVGTKYGISARSFPALDIPNLTIQQAEEAYYESYGRFDLLNDARIENKVLDLAVNMQRFGHGPATMILQQAINDSGGTCEIDESFGPNTASAANACEPAQLLENVAKRALDYYQRVEEHHPEEAAWFKGWEKRAAWIPPEQATTA
jgi:lysozyme family protein